MSHCYFAFVFTDRCEEHHHVLKIGHSKNPWSRFNDLRRMAWVGPHVLEITTRNNPSNSGFEIEQFLHNHLKKHRIHDEWFYVPHEDLEAAKVVVWQKFGEAFVLDDISDREEYPPEKSEAA